MEIHDIYIEWVLIVAQNQDDKMLKVRVDIGFARLFRFIAEVHSNEEAPGIVAWLEPLLALRSSCTLRTRMLRSS